MYLRYEFHDDASHKFWEYIAHDDALTTRWGAIGTRARSKVEEFDSTAEALTAGDRQAQTKVKRGYTEVPPPWLKPMWDAELLEDGTARVLMGDITELDELVELVEEMLVEEADELPPEARAAMAVDDDFALLVALRVWTLAFVLAQDYADEESGAAKVLAAFETLEAEGWTTGLFTDWPSLELSPTHPGGALVWVNQWENMEPDEESQLLIGVAGGSLDPADAQRRLVAALAEQGLTGAVDELGNVVVPVVWRWPVEHPVLA